MLLTTIILFCSILVCTIINSIAVDTITPLENITDGHTITSAGGEFQLGFFSRGSSTKRYLGIWYNKKSNGTVVWVANRETPLINTFGLVKVDNKGITLIANDSDVIIWSSNISRTIFRNPTAQLLDTGNLVLRDEYYDTKKIIWQSFDYPTDTLLPGMKFGVDLITGVNRYFTSWKTDDDPSLGSFTNRLDPTGYPQFLLWKGSLLWARTGPWNGYKITGTPNTSQNGLFTYRYVFDNKEIFFEFDRVSKSSPIMRFVLNPAGESKLLVWNDQQQIWIVYVSLQVTDCDRYGLCGAYGICKNKKTPRCECLKGFVPKFPHKWQGVDWSNGCIPKSNLDCQTKVGFARYSGVKLPDTRHTWYDLKIDLHECEKLCQKNCSCRAYANADVRNGGHGCLLWFSDLFDIVDYAEDGQDIYVRVPASELVGSWRSRVKKQMLFILITVLIIVVVLLRIIYLLVLKKRKQKKEENLTLSSEIVALKNSESEDLELPLFDFERIADATNNFSHDKKLGEGGFGPVYKGMLDNHIDIAVKRLSKNSSQGLDEFKNEVLCIAKLQHRNLVTLLGCCTEKGERILIYEYMANKSLDSFIFDKELRNSLDWQKRHNIINGIARGLLYLHQDSKLRIIHRDLKASNVLLDHEMNPKISDFGMARSFGGSETEANTTRVVGTYGYMSPEYAIDGLFSVKSDVYSFGVLLIEIVTGMKNRLYSHPDHSLNLIGHAWMSYKEDKLLEIIDGVIVESINQTEVFRVIQIGLLCVQQNPKDRPLMSEVVVMLTSNMKLPHPKQPGFFIERYLNESDHSLSNTNLSSSNQLTITTLLPRQ